MKKILVLTTLLYVLSIGAINAQWVAQSSGVADRLVGCHALSDNIVWVGGNSGDVFLTTDGGDSWFNHPIPDATQRVTSLYALDTKTVTAITINTTKSLGFRIYRTTDGGTTWTILYDDTKSFADAVRFFDANNGIALGDPDNDDKRFWRILLTSDGGASWKLIDSTLVPIADSAKVEQGVSNGMDVIGNNVWFCTINGGSSTTFVPHVYHSADKGKTWTSTAVTMLGYIQGIAFADEKTGYAVDLYGKAAKTTDGGNTWTAITALTTSSNYPRAVKYRQASNDIFAVGNAGVAYVSQNDGISWDQPAPATTSNFRGLTVSPTSNTCWAVGDNGIIFKWDENSTDVKICGSIPTKFDLSQNYPNPFNPTTQINYSVPKECKVTLKVYDILGHEVATLVNGTKSAGSYMVSFDASKLSTGVYIYRLEAGANIFSKKLMLMK